jgi:glycosyltransferase involved in cell wall biosynthesis
MISIDVIIPSYRLLSEYLISIVQMDIPPETQVRYFIIADNPAIETPVELVPLIDNKKIHFIRNSKNLGVCQTRNIGIDMATADWVLFIDDDVKPLKALLFKYAEAIETRPDEIGFFGEAIFPPPTNNYTRGISVSGILAFFSIGQQIEYLKWAPTLNVLIRRSAIGHNRFNMIFDKFGASEEVDFFLTIYRSTGKELCAVKNAPVFHDWWYHGKRNYSRFIRWAGGFTILINNFPEYTFYNFPNMTESLLLGLLILMPVSFYLWSPILLFCFPAGLILGECSVEFLRIIMNKGLRKSIYVIEAVRLKTSLDIGKLATQFKYHKVVGHFCKRFDHLCSGKRIGIIRRWAGLKFISYILFSIALYVIVRLLAI